MSDPLPTTRITAPARLSAAQVEAAKTDEQRAEDVAYTINHALACTATDILDPYIGNFTQRWLGKRISIGCQHPDHQHDHDHHHDHHHHDHDHDHAHHHTLSHWWIGEIIGDFGAVPFTIGLQRHAPWFMQGLRNGLEAILGPVFLKGAERSAGMWARENGVALDSKDYQDRVQMIYRHEADHLPQALMWTLSSVGINVITQKAIGNTGPVWHIAAGKAVGAGISAGLVVGGRAFAPQTARKWDQFTSENIFLPLTKSIGGLFGVDADSVDRMAAHQAELLGTKAPGVGR